MANPFRDGGAQTWEGCEAGHHRAAWSLARPVRRTRGICVLSVTLIFSRRALWRATAPRVCRPASHSPIVRQLAAARRVLHDADCARQWVPVAAIRSDDFIAIFDARYLYMLWCAVTAHSQSGRPMAATGLPLASTSMHCEYPCALCIMAALIGRAAIPRIVEYGMQTERLACWDPKNALDHARI